MSIKEKILILLNIKKGEEKVIALMLLYSFFMGAVIAFFYTAATSLFLVSFRRELFPVAYIAGGILVYAISNFYLRFQTKIKYKDLIQAGNLFLLISFTVLIFTQVFTENKWLIFLMYLWVGVVTYFHGISFWWLASNLFDLRQGKRLFGLISSGEVISQIICFFSVPVLLKFVNTEFLLYIAIVFLLLGFLTFFYIIKTNIKKLVLTSINLQNTNTINDKITFLSVLKNKYFAFIILLIILPTFGIYYVEYLFFTLTKTEFPSADILSGFLGVFLGFTAIVEFVVKTFISGRLISKYGLKLGLVALPLLLLFSTFLGSVFGLLTGVTSVFFSLIALSRIFIRVLRTAFNDPCTQILYQPLPVEKRAIFQGEIEGFSKAIGSILVGVFLIFLTSIKILNEVHLNIIFILVLIVWIWGVLKMYKEYKGKLLAIIYQNSSAIIETKNKSTNVDIISKFLKGAKSDNFDRYVSISEKLEPAYTDIIIVEMIKDSKPKLLPNILHQVEKRKLTFSLPVIHDLLERNPDSQILNILLQTGNVLEETDKLAYSDLIIMSSSAEPENRKLSARLLGFSGRYNAFKYLQNLINDKEYKVRNEALLSIGRLKRFELWPVLLEMLNSPYHGLAAATSIIKIGEPILPDLDKFFHKPSNNIRLRLRILNIIEQIGGEKAINLIRSKINTTENLIRNQALLSLSRLSYTATVSEQVFIKQYLTDEVSVVVWIIASILGLPKEESTQFLIKALEYELEIKKKNIYALLSLLYDSQTINLIKENLENGDKNSWVYALEIVDILISENIKTIVIPLLEDLPYEEYLKKMEDAFPQEKMEVSDRLIEIINKDFAKITAWTKACAMIILSDYPANNRTAGVLLSFITNPDLLLQQTAIFSLQKSFPAVLSERVALFKETKKMQFNHEIEGIKAGKFIVFEIINLFKKNRYFNKINENIVKEIAVFVKEVSLNDGDQLLFDIKGESYSYLIVSGEIAFLNKGKKIRTLKHPELIGELSEIIDTIDCLFISAGPVNLIQIDNFQLYQLMFDYPEITRNTVALIKLLNITKTYDYA